MRRGCFYCRRKRVAAGRIENDEPQPFSSIDGFGETIERHRRSYRVAIAGKLCIHRDQIIDALDRDPVTGVIYHGDVRTTRFIFELRDRPRELRNSSVGLCADDVKTGLLKHRRHGLRISLRVGKCWRILIIGIADHERDAAFGECRISPNEHNAQGQTNYGKNKLAHPFMRQPCRRSQLGHAYNPGRRSSLGDEAARPVKFVPDSGEERIGLRMHIHVHFANRSGEEFVAVVAEIGIAKFGLTQPIAGQNTFHAATYGPPGPNRRDCFTRWRQTRNGAPRKIHSVATYSDRYLLEGNATGAVNQDVGR